MGGTWCQNSYPGAAVDVQSPLYSLSSEPYDWSQMFVEQNELEEYTNHVINKHQLRSKTELNSNVSKTQWNEDTHLWEVHTDGGGIYQAQFVINASGPLSTPVIPNFPGKDKFKGKSFHTNNWDNNYDYKGKRVAIIGSGASAAQVIPAIASDVDSLHVFQRTPHWVVSRPDRVFSAMERRLLKNRHLYKALRSAIYWGLETRMVGFKYSDLMLKAVAQKRALKQISTQISDPELRAKITPDYTVGCKRVILSDTLYPALGQDNVTLHSREQGIKEITETGIVTQDGEEIELDLIVYSTGYDATDGLISYPVIGKDQRLLSDFWEQYPRAYLGSCVPGFPNLFIVTGPNTGIGHTSAIFIIEAQMNYIINSFNELKKRKLRSIEVKAGAEHRYTTHIHQEMEKTVWQSGGCNSWYKSKSGHVIAMFPGFSFTYQRWTKNFRSADHDFA